MANKRHRWTEEERSRLRELYPDMLVADIAKIIGVSEKSVYRQAGVMGLKKPYEYHSVAGKMGTGHPKAVANRFKKGCTPANKGKKMSPEVYDKIKGTMFKPGHRPANRRPVGSERVNKDGYIETKVTEAGIWKLKHRIIWEQHNGPIPKGYNVQFRNKDKQDVRIENLYLISRADQLMNENSMIAKYPEELQRVIRLRGALKRQIRKHSHE